MKFINSDERTLGISARVSQIMLVLTQLALLGVILYRAYYLNQPDEQFNDLRIILGVSVFGTLFATLFFGGHLPEVKPRTILYIYLGFVVFLFTTLSIWLGLPKLEEWQTTILPVVLGPAILLGLYWGFAKLGKMWIERNIEE